MRTEIIFIDEETLTAEEYESAAEESVPDHFKRYFHEVESYGQTEK